MTCFFMLSIALYQNKALNCGVVLYIVPKMQKNVKKYFTTLVW